MKDTGYIKATKTFSIHSYSGERKMADNQPIVQKNGKGYIFHLSTMQIFFSLLISLGIIFSAVLLPYKTFTEYQYITQAERIYNKKVASEADSLAKLAVKYSIENNYNMKNYFEQDQPKNFKWIPFDEIKKRFYLP